MPEELCIDLIRFSDGKLTPDAIGDLAADQILELLNSGFDFVGHKWFGRHALEAATKYSPIYAETLAKEVNKSTKGLGRPLVWKEVTIPDGSQVRMQYGGEHFIAEISDGHIRDADGSFTPSEWASKIAMGTSRNAWRDLWFREGISETWVPAQMMREQAQKRM